MEGHAPAGGNVTFRTLGFKAHPYLMPKDTIVNKAASQVIAHLSHYSIVCHQQAACL